ncbi:PAS domain S-box protein [Rhizobacter sp. SG703]|uniref:PAS domain S-box protein n=1 Tax=Rhizobacter sp. SG703 TaxID=2587140 RepID=UPI001446FFA7|nr:PAS domain S-box-containing protein [Rhizobacter sp. SG703]
MPPPFPPADDLGAIIARVQSRYIRAAPPREMLSPLLTDLLESTACEYGFIAEVLHDGDGAPYLRFYVLTDISWDDATRALYERHMHGGPEHTIEFHNMRTLFGAAILGGAPVISNDPDADPRRGGLPPGHPAMRSFLGVPLFHGGEMLGMVGLANRPGGFDQALVDRLQPLFTSVGAILGAVRHDRERREAENALRASETQLRAVLEMAGAGIVQIGLDGFPLFLNQQLCDMLGRSRAELLALSTEDVTHPEDLAGERRRRRQLLAGEIPRYRADKRYLHADGRVVWATLNVTLVRKPDGHPDYLIGVVQDITERKQAESELRASRQRFVDLLNSVDGIFWEGDPRTESFTFVSDKAKQLLGYPLADWMQPRFWALHLHPDDRDRALREVADSQLTGSVSAIEYRFYAADRSVRWMSSWVTVFRPEGGRRLLRGLMIDITERKRVEEAVLAAESAQRANAAKTEFLSRMSHELRTPLNAVLGFAQLLELDTQQPLNAAQQARVRHITQAGTHLLAMINDVLDLSRIESGGVALLSGSVVLRRVVDEALAMVAPAAAEAGVQLLIDRAAPHSADPRTCVLADHLRLRQVLVNLLSNAIKYNRRGGQVVLRWPADEGVGLVHLQVRDTGVGLTAAQAAHLFEPFNRLGAERSGVEGTGIGLVITQRLVQLMNGRLSVESEPGVGSVFTASLPWVPVATVDGGAGPGFMPADPVDAATPAAPYTVLYAEDNPMNVELVRQVMKMRPDCRLLVAANGRQAVEMGLQHRPDLLLLDMHLGDMSGVEVSRQLDAALGCPRIALSADATPEQAEAARAAGFIGYLTKPVNVAQLLRCLDEQRGADANPGGFH